MKAVIIIATPCSLTLHGKWEKEGKFGGTGILFEEPNPTGSRPSDLIGLDTKWQRAKRPQPAKRSSREEGGCNLEWFIQVRERLQDSLVLEARRVAVARIL